MGGGSRWVLYGELTERSYTACDCDLVRDGESVTVWRLPACASCDAPLRDAADRKRCAACKRALYCGKACQRAHWKAGHKEECARSRD